MAVFPFDQLSRIVFPTNALLRSINKPDVNYQELLKWISIFILGA